MIRETSIFQEIFDQRYNEGFVAGKIQGELEGKQRFLQKQIEKRFGPLSVDSKVRLLELNSEALDALATAFWDLATGDDLRAWLIKMTTN